MWTSLQQPPPPPPGLARKRKRPSSGRSNPVAATDSGTTLSSNNVDGSSSAFQTSTATDTTTPSSIAWLQLQSTTPNEAQQQHEPCHGYQVLEGEGIWMMEPEEDGIEVVVTISPAPPSSTPVRGTATQTPANSSSSSTSLQGLTRRAIQNIKQRKHRQQYQHQQEQQTNPNSNKNKNNQKNDSPPPQEQQQPQTSPRMVLESIRAPPPPPPPSTPIHNSSSNSLALVPASSQPMAVTSLTSPIHTPSHMMSRMLEERICYDSFRFVGTVWNPEQLWRIPSSPTKIETTTTPSSPLERFVQAQSNTTKTANSDSNSNHPQSFGSSSDAAVVASAAPSVCGDGDEDGASSSLPSSVAEQLWMEIEQWMEVLPSSSSSSSNVTRRRTKPHPQSQEQQPYNHTTNHASPSSTTFYWATQGDVVEDVDHQDEGGYDTTTTTMIEPLYRDSTTSPYQPVLTSWTPTMQQLRNVVSETVAQPLNHATISCCRCRSRPQQQHHPDSSPPQSGTRCHYPNKPIPLVPERSYPTLDLEPNSGIVTLVLTATPKRTTTTTTTRTTTTAVPMMRFRHKRNVVTAMEEEEDESESDRGNDYNNNHNDRSSSCSSSNIWGDIDEMMVPPSSSWSSPPTTSWLHPRAAVASSSPPAPSYYYYPRAPTTVELPEGSLVYLGPRTNRLMTHEIAVVPLPGDDDPDQADEMYICITFRQVATFQCESLSLSEFGGGIPLVFGKGATCSTLEQALEKHKTKQQQQQQQQQRLLETQTLVAQQRLKTAFALEQGRADFDPRRYYGAGFDVVPFQSVVSSVLSNLPLLVDDDDHEDYGCDNSRIVDDACDRTMIRAPAAVVDDDDDDDANKNATTEAKEPTVVANDITAQRRRSISTTGPEEERTSCSAIGVVPFDRRDKRALESSFFSDSTRAIVAVPPTARSCSSSGIRPSPTTLASLTRKALLRIRQSYSSKNNNKTYASIHDYEEQEEEEQGKIVRYYDESNNSSSRRIRSVPGAQLFDAKKHAAACSNGGDVLLKNPSCVGSGTLLPRAVNAARREVPLFLVPDLYDQGESNTINTSDTTTITTSSTPDGHFDVEEEEEDDDGDDDGDEYDNHNDCGYQYLTSTDITEPRLRCVCNSGTDDEEEQSKRSSYDYHETKPDLAAPAPADRGFSFHPPLWPRKNISGQQQFSSPFQRMENSSPAAVEPHNSPRNNVQLVSQKYETCDEKQPVCVAKTISTFLSTSSSFSSDCEKDYEERKEITHGHNEGSENSSEWERENADSKAVEMESNIFAMSSSSCSEDDNDENVLPHGCGKPKEGAAHADIDRNVMNNNQETTSNLFDPSFCSNFSSVPPHPPTTNFMPKSSTCDDNHNGIALLAIDLQNDYLGDDDPSFFSRRICSSMAARRDPLLHRIGELAGEVRMMGGVVFFLKSRYGAWSPSSSPRRKNHKPKVAGGMGGAATTTNAGAEFHPDVEKSLIQHDGQDVVLIKEWYSAFMGTTLHRQLQRMKIKNLVVCGVTTNHSVAATVRSACNYRYNVILSSDGTAQIDDRQQKRTLSKLTKYSTILDQGQTISSLVSPNPCYYMKEPRPVSQTVNSLCSDKEGALLEFDAIGRLSGFGTGDSITVPDFLDKEKASEWYQAIVPFHQSQSYEGQKKAGWSQIALIDDLGIKMSDISGEQQGNNERFLDTVQTIRSLAESQSGHSFNVVQVQCYDFSKKGSDVPGSLDFNSAVEKNAFSPLHSRSDSFVATVALGGDRILELQPRTRRMTGSGCYLTRQRVYLRHNSLLLLGPDTICHFFHSFTFPSDEDDEDETNRERPPQVHVTFVDAVGSNAQIRKMIPALLS